MILVRDVFQAKYGRGDELVKLFKEINDQMAGFLHYRRFPLVRH